MSEIELKACPFCGAPAQGWRDVSRPEQKEAGYGALQYGVKCESDLVCEAEIVGFATREEADAAWNSRAPQWQPIESIPNGVIALFCDMKATDMCKAFFVDWMLDGKFCDNPRHTATHWQRISAPPEVSA